MTQYKIKIFNQQTQECCKVLSCKKHILQEVKEEYSRVVEDVDLPDGAYFSRLYVDRIYNGLKDEIMVEGSIEYPLVSKNHEVRIN